MLAGPSTSTLGRINFRGMVLAQRIFLRTAMTGTCRWSSLARHLYRELIMVSSHRWTSQRHLHHSCASIVRARAVGRVLTEAMKPDGADSTWVRDDSRPVS